MKPMVFVLVYIIYQVHLLYISAILLLLTFMGEVASATQYQKPGIQFQARFHGQMFRPKLIKSSHRSPMHKSVDKTILSIQTVL